MSGPTKVSLKRRREEDAPDILVLDSSNKRAATPTSLHYVRQPSKEDVHTNFTQHPYGQSGQSVTQQSNSADPKLESGRRYYHLNQRKRKKNQDEDIATFAEKHPDKKARNDPGPFMDAGDALNIQSAVSARPLKRPNTKAAVQRSSVPVQTDTDPTKVEELAQFMHEAALEEVEREERDHQQQHRILKTAAPSRRVATPKLSGQRSKEIHQRRIATNASISLGIDLDIEDDSDYVYDTYVLASASDSAATPAESFGDMANVGYLVITEEDQSLWETYLEDEPSDKDWNSDEEDENAEDFYGADYPEDELASDDEFDRNAYGYRGHAGSDDEEWDEDTGAYSDDEYERMMHPFKFSTMPT